MFSRKFPFALRLPGCAAWCGFSPTCAPTRPFLFWKAARRQSLIRPHLNDGVRTFILFHPLPIVLRLVYHNQILRGRILQMSDRVSIRVPATGANLGCLFDCGGIALSLYLDIRVTPRADDEIVVHYRGVTADRVHMGADNLIARTMRETLRGWGKTRGFELEIENQIPVGAG